MTFERRDIHNSDVPEICKSCEARHKGVCGALTPTQLVELAKHTRRHVRDAGEVLLRDAEVVETHSNILKGVVKLSKILTDGRQQIVGLQFAPDFLGRPLTKESKITAEAASEVTVCSFPKSTLDRILEQNKALEHRLLEQALKELDDARDWMVTLGRKTAKEKVASFLHLIASHIDPELDNVDGVTFLLPMSRSDIADFLGLTIETVSRQITRLRQSGVIELTTLRNVVVPDIGRLRDEAGD